MKPLLIGLLGVLSLGVRDGQAQSRLSACSPLTVRRVLGDKALVPGNARLARIENGRVACLHAEEGTKADCLFTVKSGIVVETAEGHYALVGQSISLEGQRGGDYVVATEVSRDDTVPCVEPTSADSAGTAAGEELAWCCTREAMLSATNFHSQPLVNFATQEVCTSSYPHPDGALFTRMNGTSYCYTGRGAALNDQNGRERDEAGVYLPGSEHCHVVYTGAYETTGAKRPATTSWPATVNIHSPIVWRPVTQVQIAN